MKTVLISSALAAVASAASWLGAETPRGLSDSDWSGIRAAHERQLYGIVANPDGTHQARNPGQAWLTRFDSRGFTVTPDAGGWEWGLELIKYGGRTLLPGSGAKEGPVRHEGGQIFCLRDECLTEWYVNDVRGMEQGWTLSKRPERADAAAELRLDFAVRGSLRPQLSIDGASVAFLSDMGVAALTYGGLKAWDVDGKAVPARFAVGETAGSALCVVVDDAAAIYPITIDPLAQQAYLKASNTGVNDKFGYAVAVSGDTVVVGASGEASNATGVNGDQTDNSVSSAGAAYVFVRSRNLWTQQAYLKASNTGANDNFGCAVAVSGDTVVVGASLEASNATGVDGIQNDNSAAASGAAYVFVRNGSAWSQQAYLKASNTDVNDNFGRSVAVSYDTVVVGATGEASSATGVNGVQTDNLLPSSGAAYVFARSGSAWSQQAYLKADNTGPNFLFGNSVAVSGDTVVVGSPGKRETVPPVGPSPAALFPGAAYVFVRSSGAWSQQAYLMASNAEAGDRLGTSVAVSGDTVVVGATGEASSATGINGNQADNAASGAGAAYVFLRAGSAWSQQAYLKASNTGASDVFGLSVAVSGDTVAVGAHRESSNATGVNGNQDDDPSALSSGAAYVFARSETTWSQQAYLKASNTDAGDYFGYSVAVSGNTVVVGAYSEDGLTTGVNGDQQNDFSPSSAGAAYVFLSSFSTPTTAEQYIARGRISLAQGSNTLLSQAAADFAFALELSPTNEEAHLLRALTNLLLLQIEPAFNQALSSLGASRADLDAPIVLPEDLDGDPLFKADARSSILINWVTSQVLPRLATVRSDLVAVASNDFRTALSAGETGGLDTLVDKGDVLVIKAMTHGLEMLFQLLFTYNLDVPFNAMVALDKNGQLDAQHVLATSSSLLKFASGDRRPQFAAELRAMQLDYAAASDFIRNQRGDPANLLTDGLSTDPEKEIQIRDTLASAVASLSGEVVYQGTRVNLSRLMTSGKTLRDWVPEIRGGEVVPGTFPDPTFDGILPGMAEGELNNRIYQMGIMWGMAQYAEEIASLLGPLADRNDPREDLDGDGRDNFAEWLAHSNPLVQDTVWQDLTHNVIVPGKNEVRLSFVRRKDLRDWKLRVAVSDDMQTWDRTETQIEMVGTPVSNGDNFTETVTYRLKEAAALAARKFLRVEAVPQ